MRNQMHTKKTFAVSNLWLYIFLNELILKFGDATKQVAFLLISETLQGQTEVTKMGVGRRNLNDCSYDSAFKMGDHSRK